MTSTDILELAHRASLATLGVTAQVVADDLPRPTPCTAWNVGDLLGHMEGQNWGFVAAAEGRGDALSAWAPVAVSGIAPGAGYARSVHAVVRAFTAAVEGGHRLRLPEVDPDHEFRAPVAIAFHLVDSVAHGWDLARAIGAPYSVDADILAAATDVAAMIPDDEGRTAASALFAPGRGTSDGTAFGKFLSLLGRSPYWSAEALSPTSQVQ